MKTIVIAVAMLGGDYLLWGQASQSAQIAGTVQDASSSAIGQAHLVLTNTGTGITHQTVSGADGAYTLPNLPPGTYRLSVAKPGFAALQRGKLGQTGRGIRELQLPGRRAWFLAHPELTAESPKHQSGNSAHLDQVAAVQPS